ncbi:restriction endonuclease subunit S [Acinetobacter sp.]|uniref:restriction endonuclease subunit S n=1 Tax=Acinetobacter sp. TaxID=472 RepID=UPI0028A1E882|nr:restriction endonuclease subunit S [Acinetobacter sp.]
MISDKKLLGDFASVISGYAFKSEWFGSGNDKVIRIGDLQDGSVQIESALTVDANQYKISNNFKIQNKDILMALSGATVGKIAIASETDIGAYINQRVAIIRAKDEITADYLKFFFSGVFLDDLLKNAGGAAQPNLSPKQLLFMEIPFPPLSEQRRIASILDKADELRQKRQQAIEKLDQLLQATFLDMFGDFQINPMNWQTKPLSEVVNNTTIVTYGIVQAGEEYRDGIPYIRTGDIKNGSILTENLSRTDPEIAKKFKRSEVQTGDIVMSIRATVGTTALVPKILNGANLTQGTARIAVGENIEREYALYHLRCQATQNWIQKQVKGATFREITLGKLRELPVYLPPRDLQKKFVEIYNSIEMLKLNANKSLESSKQLFKSLQNQAFSGNL